LVSGVSVNVDLDCAGWEFGNHDSDWCGDDGIGAVGLLHIKRASSVIVGHAACVDRDCAVGRLRNGCAVGRIYFVIATVCGLIVNPIVIIKRHSGNRQGEESEGQFSEVAVEMEIVRAVVATDLNVQVVVDKGIMAIAELAPLRPGERS